MHVNVAPVPAPAGFSGPVADIEQDQGDGRHPALGLECVAPVAVVPGYRLRQRGRRHRARRTFHPNGAPNMTIPLQITFQNMDPSPAIEASVRKRAQRLERFSDRIVSCKVVVESPHRHQHHGRIYNIGIELSVPGRDIQVTRSPGKDHAHEDVYVAIRDAFNAAARQLEDHTRRLRADVKTHESPMLGVVARLFPERDYGFIRNAELGEVYFHANSVANAAFEDLTVGNEVRMSVAERESPHGFQATTVTVVGKHHPVG